MVEKTKSKIKNLKVNLINIEDVDFVTVRKYEGIENNRHAWTFLGYDIVEKRESEAISLTIDDKKYTYLEEIEGSISQSGRPYYNHDGIKVGDIRVKSDDLLDSKTIINKALIKGYKLKPGINRICISKDCFKDFASSSNLEFYSDAKVKAIK